MDTTYSVNVTNNPLLNTAAADSIASVQPVPQDRFASYGQSSNPPAAQPLIYTTGNDGRQHVFSDRKDADAFTWQQYQQAHPDAQEQGHVDNGWDAFKRGFSDTVKNPLGQTVAQIAKAAGSSPQTQQALYDAGGNPLGFIAGETAAAAGASQQTQDKLQKGGEVAESLVPGWGQARYYGKLAANAVDGKAPSAEDALNVSQDLKGIATPHPSASAAHGENVQPAALPKKAQLPSFNPPQRLPDGRIGYPLGPTNPPKLPAENPASTQQGPATSIAGAGVPADATASAMANRDTLAQRVSQSPYANTPGSYPNTVGLVNDALKKGGVGLSDSSLANIQTNMDNVDSGSMANAQASQRESGSFAKDAMNAQLPLKDRLTAAAGAFINGTLGPAYLAERDVATYVAGGSNANAEQRAMMSGMMTHDPLYN